MGFRPLGPRWLRRIALTTGLEIVHANGNGGYVFVFTTADHRHGWFDLKRWRATRPWADLLDFQEEAVWALYPPSDPCTWRFSSCRTLFPQTIDSPPPPGGD